MTTTKGGFNFSFQNYNSAQDNNVSKGISEPAPSPPTPLLSEKNNFTRHTLPTETIELGNDGVQDPRVQHQHPPTGGLHQIPLVNQLNPSFTTHLMPTLNGQRNVRINLPDGSSLNSNMLPQLRSYQSEPMPGRINQSGLVFSNMSGTGFSNENASHTGSPFINDLMGIGRSRSEMGVSNLMMAPQTGSYQAMKQHIANDSNIHLSAYSMPPHTRQSDCTSIPLDSDLSSINFGMIPQPVTLLTRPHIGYLPVTTSSQIGSFQIEKPEYRRTRPDMGFPSLVMSQPTCSLYSEHPNGSTNASYMGSLNTVMPQLTNSAHAEHQKSSTIESGTDTGFQNLVAMQPQVNSSQNSAILTTPNTEPSSIRNMPPQGSELEGRRYQEMVPTEEVATNQVTTENQGIDLNKTPQQKPRRRKYVPKVVTGKKPRAPRKITPKKASEDQPKRKYVRKKGVEPPPVETPGNANGAGKPVGNSNSVTQDAANPRSNPFESPPSRTSNAANWLHKMNDLPNLSTLNAETMQDKPIEASQSCTPNSVNGHNKLAEASMPCMPNITTGLNKPIDIFSSSTNTVVQFPNCRTASGMNGPYKSVRRCLNFDSEEVRSDGYKHAQSQPDLNAVSACSARRNVSTLPITTSSVSVGPSPSKGIALDLNSSEIPWQEEFDQFVAQTGNTDQVLGTNQTPGRSMSSTNSMPTELDSLIGDPCPPRPRPTNNSIVAPSTPGNRGVMGTYEEKVAALAKNNANLISDRINAHIMSNSYSNAPGLMSDGRKRDHSALVNDTSLTGQVRAELSPRIIQTSKKMKIWNGNNTRQNGTKNNASPTVPPVRPDNRVLCLADAQRWVELKKRNNPNMLYFRNPGGNTGKAPVMPSGPACTSTSVTPSTPVKLAQTVNGTSRNQIYHPGVSIQTFAERTATLNQCVDTSYTQPSRPITSVGSGVNRVTLEMLTGSRNMNATSTQPVDHIIQPYAANLRNESCQIGATVQTVSEKTTEKPVADICPPPSTPAKSPILNPPSKSEPKRRGRRPKSEKAGTDTTVAPRPKGRPGRPPGKKSFLSSANLMAGGPTALAYTLDLIIQRMSGLDINRINETVPGQPCYAMVPYQNGVRDGTMVLYDDGKVKKKRKLRAQVNLDPVTSQVWNLLMGKEMKDGIEAVNEKDEKVMEAEREVFRGRVDSFIARMHLVQGDRRFSPWKGSVVDSVVGVFLTQNVSDHLSSSAFMALVAKYPLKTQLQNSQPRESTLIVSRPRNTNPYARDLINLTKWHRQREVIIEDFTDIGSQVTSEEKDSNESQGSTTKCPGSSPEKKMTGSPDSGPGLVINSSSDDPTSESVVSSQNSVVSNQSSPDYLFQPGEQNFTGLGLLGNYSADGHAGNASLPVGTRLTSYTQLLRMAESNGVDFSQDLNKETADLCSSSNISQFYPQNWNIYSGTSSTLNNAQNGVYPSSAAPAMNNSRAQELTTPMIKITTTSGKTHGYIPVQEEKKMYQVESAQPPVQQTQQQVQSIPSASNLQYTPNANNNKHSKVSSDTVQGKQSNMTKALDGTVIDEGVSSKSRKGKGASGKGKKNFDWDSLRKGVLPDGVKKERTYKTTDSLDYEALKNASVSELSDAIRERGMNNMLAERIKAFLDRIENDHGSIDLEWLRDVDPDKAKDYLLSIRGLGLKSVECVRLLTLHHMAFPVDTNVGRICVRLGWVPLQPLPESLQLHLLEMYPILENIQKFLWPRLCKLDQRTLYELHYQMITFGKVFCTKSKPNCNACPMRAECKHFASAFASARLALPAPEEKGMTAAALPAGPSTSTNLHPPFPSRAPPPQIEGSSTSSSSFPIPFPYPTPVNLSFPNQPQSLFQPRVSNPTLTPTQTQTCNEPIIEEPASPEPEPEPEPEPVAEKEIGAIEDAFLEDDPDEIPVIKLDFKEFTQNLKNYIQANNLEIEEADMSKAVVAISPEAASLPVPKLKNISRLRTEHQVYELPDNHTLLDGFEPREPDDPSPYLLSIWTPGETAMSTEPPKSLCISQDVDELCDNEACARCASIKEARSRIVRGTILIPCRTAMRGSFPLNGTYFQVNEMFADHETSRVPVDISRAWIWNLPRRTVYFGTSIPTIFKGLSTEEIQHCFWRGFVCVRGFDRTSRAPRPLYARLHFPASKLTRNGKKSAAAKDDE